MRAKAVLWFCSIFTILTIAAACGTSTPNTDPATEPTGAATAQEAEATQPEPTAIAEAEPTAATADPETMAAETSPPMVEDTATEVSPATPPVFIIDRTRSEARFSIDEVLLGQDKTVVGVTSLVTGTLTVDPDNPALSAIGPITINARDFKTDSSRRNRSIQRQVLRSARPEYEFITFTPTSIDGMPESVVIGEPFSFTVTGDLTIVDTTRPETFTLTVTADSERELHGSAATTVLRADYDIRIPSVPAVAGVSEEASLEFDFVAIQSE